MTQPNLATADAIADDLIIWSGYSLLTDPDETLIEIFAVRLDEDELSIHNSFSIEEAQALVDVLTKRIADAKDVKQTVRAYEKANLDPDMFN